VAQLFFADALLAGSGAAAASRICFASEPGRSQTDSAARKQPRQIPEKVAGQNHRNDRFPFI